MKGQDFLDHLSRLYSFSRTVLLHGAGSLLCRSSFSFSLSLPDLNAFLIILFTMFKIPVKIFFIVLCRHPSNLMLDRLSGKILHIDFGDCFEVAMTREKFPEKIPFRLTRMLSNAMEASTEFKRNLQI
jgi:Phosphatidylinositol kinase and protein kinases of the PI-3 kinase family